MILSVYNYPHSLGFTQLFHNLTTPKYHYNHLWFVLRSVSYNRAPLCCIFPIKIAQKFFFCVLGPLHWSHINLWVTYPLIFANVTVTFITTYLTTTDSPWSAPTGWVKQSLSTIHLFTGQRFLFRNLFNFLLLWLMYPHYFDVQANHCPDRLPTAQFHGEFESRRIGVAISLVSSS